jgi:hypothetical protein
VNHSTAAHLWSADRTLTSTTGSLLLERLATGTANFTAGLCRLGALACCCLLGNNYLVD